MAGPYRARPNQCHSPTSLAQPSHLPSFPPPASASLAAAAAPKPQNPPRQPPPPFRAVAGSERAARARGRERESEEGTGGGRKRGRTQRRHLKQGRENVWKHNPQRPVAAGSEGAEWSGDGREGNPSWQPFATENRASEVYYKVRSLASDDADAWFTDFTIWLLS
uniref:Uncharacterized protein n=1 Tax=Oryza brachyantha TaxID=4533 RepID=J3MYD7_ORYBR